MNKEWLKEFQASRIVTWFCSYNQQDTRKTKGSGSKTKVGEALTVQLIEVTNKNEVLRIR